MTRYTPTLVAIYDSYGDRIGERIKQLIATELNVQSIPEVFQFVTISNPDKLEPISQAYATALSARTIAAAESTLKAKIDASRLESYVVAPLGTDALRVALAVSRVIDDWALNTISGGRNAVFLISRRLLSLPDESLKSAADELELVMSDKNRFPFGRCFFIDEVNEMGQTVDREEDLMDLVANFISLAIASEFSEVLRNNPAPYAGAPPHYAAYASFSCDRVYFDRDAFARKLGAYLAEDVKKTLLTGRAPGTAFDGLTEQGTVLLRESIELGERPQPNSVNDSVFKPIDEVEYRKLMGSLGEFMQTVCNSVGHNLDLYRMFLERYLEIWLSELESLAGKARALKRGMAEATIREILNYAMQEPESYLHEERRNWWQILTFRKPKLVTRQRFRSVAASKAAKDKLIEYSRLTENLELHCALFTRLEAALVNLDLFKKPRLPVVDPSLSNLFAHDLVDDELAKRFYQSPQYTKRDTDIGGFVSAPEFKRFMNELFSYPGGDPVRHLNEYCVNCFGFVHDYRIERIFDIRRQLSDRKELMCLLTPFWRPIAVSTGEKVTLFSCSSEESEVNLMRVLDARNHGSATIVVPSANAESISVVQISYGMKLHDILVYAESTSSTAFTAAATG